MDKEKNDGWDLAPHYSSYNLIATSNPINPDNTINHLINLISNIIINYNTISDCFYHYFNIITVNIITF